MGKVLILGHSGLIGGRVERLLKRERPGCRVLGRSIRETDLTRSAEAGGLSELLDDQTALVVCSGIKPQVAGDRDAFEKNVSMALNLAKVLEARPVRRVVYLSSAAVYGEEVEDTAITERTPARPGSYYGMAKLASELLLAKAAEGRSSLAILRPPLVYGPGDATLSYGPSLFIDSALKGKALTLWGEGDELREFLFVDDLAALILRSIDGSYEGALNAASGQSHSFREMIAVLEGMLGRPVDVESRPRSRRKVDCAFAPGRLAEVFPDFRFTPLRQGLESTLRAMEASAA